MAGETHIAGPRFRIREATKDDISDMTDVFFKSFNAAFWQYFIPDNPKNREWWDKAWALGLDNSTDRSFVVEDTEKDNKIVAFSRWMVPQQDGNRERKWPDLKEEDWDMEVAGAFFGGMEVSRETLMEKRPHWMLELLGVHEDYQRQGIAASLIKWGTDQADRDGLESYLDGSEIGQPYYKKRHAFERHRCIFVPDRKEYGSFAYFSMIRPPQK